MKFSDKADHNFVLETLTGLKVRPNIILHADLGSVYICKWYRQAFLDMGIKQSFSEKASTAQNALIEPFCIRLKCETFYLIKNRLKYLTSEKVIKIVADYNHNYNHSRMIKYNNNLSPLQARQQA
ncbi:transposase [Candidatus Phytoplasma australiense]|uniref:Putative transposase tra5 for insertion sequence element IS150 n=1 Tax=Strawberry lethal yellows phytoplasma (CPA) str. NZSb11 TaxID=980422 RepID=R4S0F0_PHYAS|nr:transposase [Candidatus Phytoplasma australiense]AGL90238.1 Putative transposase tra5 for insertion sequence element IS150 [Strawberry lethal yellows phytoplasma (CPA) str. NZSb11]